MNCICCNKQILHHSRSQLIDCYEDTVGDPSLVRIRQIREKLKMKRRDGRMICKVCNHPLDDHDDDQVEMCLDDIDPTRFRKRKTAIKELIK